MRILLIDDDPFTLKLLARQLAELGYTEVIRCQQAREALRSLESHSASIDLVICDLHMPGMDGVECVRHMARIDYTGGLVLLSGENVRVLQTVERLARAHQLNVVGILGKPISLARLQQLLKENSPCGARVLARVAQGYTPKELEAAISGRRAG